MRHSRGLFLLTIIMIVVSVILETTAGAAETRKTVNRSYSAAPPDALKSFEPEYHEFKGISIADKTIYFRQRKIGEAIVQRDYITYLLDRDTKELLDTGAHWRDDLPDRLPTVISRAQAESMVDGEISYSQLFYIAEDSHVFPIKPTPKNPCWILESLNNNMPKVTVIDAVEGNILGPGVPPPSNTAFSMSGPQTEEEGCFVTGAWTEWYLNARDWFDAMGYSTQTAYWPGEETIRNQIQSDAAMFYMFAHGGYDVFEASYDSNSCAWVDTWAYEIEQWLAGYLKIPFTFLGHCYGMCDTNDGSLSYEYRKGSFRNTATVGYCNMSDEPCVTECWYADYTVDWQNAMFDYMSRGWSVKAAFDQANIEYPACSTSECMRFAGDETFQVVPLVNRGFTAAYPYPQDYACGADVNVGIHWIAGAKADSHDVYFGTNFNDVNDANNSWPVGVSAYKGCIDVNNYDPCTLEPNTWYYWRIDEVNESDINSPWKGNIWRFTTIDSVVVPDDYPTIQQAIDLAMPGVTITVAEGTYLERIEFKGKAITVTSTDPDNKNTIAATVIDGDGYGPVVSFVNKADSVLAGLTITGGNRGISCASASPTIINCRITDNTSTGDGGGIYLDSSSPTILGCEITNNSTSAHRGGAIYCINCIGPGPNISECFISGNTATMYGGAIYCENTDARIANCIVSGNVSQYGGAIYCSLQGNASVRNCTFTGNRATNMGGCFFGINAELSLRDTILWANSAPTGPEIGWYGSGSPVWVLASYCDIKGGQEQVHTFGTAEKALQPGCIDVDPCFVAAGYWDVNENWVDGDYHLRSEGWRWDGNAPGWVHDQVTSRCVDAGNPGCSLNDEPLTLSVDPNNDRGVNLRINMGAYGRTLEASIPPFDWALLGDLTSDGIVSLGDFACQAEDWKSTDPNRPGDLNRDAVVDGQDLKRLVEDWLRMTIWK